MRKDVSPDDSLIIFRKVHGPYRFKQRLLNRVTRAGYICLTETEEERGGKPEETEEISPMRSQAFAFPGASRTCLRVLLPLALGYSGAITALFDGLKRFWIKLSTHLRETSPDIIACGHGVV